MIQVNDVNKIYLMVKELGILREEIVAINSIAWEAANKDEPFSLELFKSSKNKVDNDPSFFQPSFLSGLYTVFQIQHGGVEQTYNPDKSSRGGFLSKISLHGSLQIMGILLQEKEQRIIEILAQLKKYGIAE